MHVCFSATANFVGSGVLAGIGIATMREVKHRRELLFASLPLLFAVHQFTEGFVWLGLDHMASPTVLKDAGAAYILYAQGLLPFLMPLSVLLLESMAKRRKLMMGFVALGTALALYILWGLIAYPVDISVKQNSIVYVNVISTTTLVAVLYVGATCGALFFSGFKDLVILAWLNLAGLLVVMEIRRYAFTSVWCAYAAAASVILLGYFWKSHFQRPFLYEKAA